MKKTFLVLVTLILTLLQVTYTYRVCFGWYNYSLMLTAVIVLTTFDSTSGYISAVVCGFFMDCLLGGVNSMYLLICVFAAFVTHMASKLALRQGLLTVLLLTFVITFFSELVQFWIFVAREQSGSVAYALKNIIFPQAFINSFAAVFVYCLYAWLWRKYFTDKGGRSR